MPTKFIALLVAGIALTGCCATGTVCSTATPGVPMAWDGLGEAPTTNDGPATENRPKRRAARNHEIIVGPLSDAPPRAEAKSRPEDQWTKLPNEDREADAKLARQLRICRDC